MWKLRGANFNLVNMHKMYAYCNIHSSSIAFLKLPWNVWTAKLFIENFHYSLNKCLRQILINMDWQDFMQRNHTSPFLNLASSLSFCKSFKTFLFISLRPCGIGWLSLYNTMVSKVTCLVSHKVYYQGYLLYLLLIFFSRAAVIVITALLLPVFIPLY